MNESKTNEEKKDLIVQPPSILYLQKRNKCLVISNEFEGDRQLLGYRQDVKNILQTCEMLHFDACVRNNLSTSSMIKEFTNWGRKDYGDDEMLMVFLMSHGGKERTIYGVDESSVKVDKLVNSLNQCESLYGKPKLIFVQACRGVLPSEVVEIPIDEDTGSEVNTGGEGSGTEGEEEEPKRKQRVVRKSKDADILVYYSTTEGNTSYVDNEHGSFFMQAVCKVFQSYGGRYPLSSMITKINEVVALHIVQDGYKEYVESCEVSHRLTCDIYFKSTAYNPLDYVDDRDDSHVRGLSKAKSNGMDDSRAKSLEDYVKKSIREFKENEITNNAMINGKIERCEDYMKKHSCNVQMVKKEVKEMQTYLQEIVQEIYNKIYNQEKRENEDDNNHNQVDNDTNNDIIKEISKNLDEMYNMYTCPANVRMKMVHVSRLIDTLAGNINQNGTNQGQKRQSHIRETDRNYCLEGIATQTMANTRRMDMLERMVDKLRRQEFVIQPFNRQQNVPFQLSNHQDNFMQPLNRQEDFMQSLNQYKSVSKPFHVKAEKKSGNIIKTKMADPNATISETRTKAVKNHKKEMRREAPSTVGIASSTVGSYSTAGTASSSDAEE